VEDVGLGIHNQTTHRGKPFLGLCLAWIIFGLGALTTLGEPAVHYSFRLWQTQDGLPENTVQAFAQTPDGFLWVGTTGGLSRFDGNGFDKFDHTNTPALTESSIVSLLVSRDGDLLIGTDGGGLVQYHAGQFARMGVGDGLEHASIRSLLEDAHGILWIGTDSGVFRRLQAGVNKFQLISDVAPISVQALVEDHEGRLWAGGDRLFVIDTGHSSEQQLPWLQNNQITSICETRDGTIWIGTLKGLWRSYGHERLFERVNNIRGTVRSLYETKESALWVGTGGDGVFSVRKTRVTQVKTPSATTSSVLSIFQDGSSNLWLGTQAGMLRVTPSSITIIHLPKISASEFGTVYLDARGTLWVASRRLYKVRNDHGMRVTLPQLQGSSVRNVLMDEDGTLWFGTNGNGVFHLLPHKTVHYTVDTGLANNFIRVFIQAHDGSIWLGTDVGLSHLKGNSFQNFGLQDGLCHLDIHAIVEGAEGDIWIGTALGLSHLHDGKFVEDAATRGLRSEKVWSISSIHNGLSMLFGTRHGGLYEYSEGRLSHFTTAQGLSSDSIYKITRDLNDHLWLSGPDGVSRVSITDLERQAIGAVNELSLRTYYITDDGNTVQFYGGMQPAGAIGPEGDMWFPSNRGVVHIALDERTILPPKLRVKSVVSDGKAIDGDAPVRLSADNSNLEIVYAPIMLRPQMGMHYRYKLIGFDKEWINALTRKTAYYTNIPAGTYTFLVRGYEADRPDVFSETQLIFVKKPYFYRTWWFMSLALLCACLAVWTVHLLKVRNVNRRFLAILEERGRLAREIHDTVLQGCASVSSLLEASSSAEDEPQLHHKLIEYARSQISVTIDEARKAVWNLRQTSEESKSISHLIEEMAARTSGEFGIPVRCRTTGEPQLLDAILSHEIIMVIREGLYNALVHSNAKAIEISTDFLQGTLSVSVRDNGSGFDPRHSFDEHYGLVGMKERIIRLGGSIEIHSQLGRGTDVFFSVPTATIQMSKAVAV
jgi:ligand-binding sensor domain-containing protein/two-component sensor histidine kinase